MKTQTKIALTFFLISLTTIVVLSASVYFFISRYSFTDFYKRLEIRGIVTAKAELDHEDASQAVLQEVRKLHLEKLPEEKEYFFRINPESTFKHEADSLNLPLSFFVSVIETGVGTYQAGDVFFSGIRHNSKNGDYVVIVSATNHFGTQLMTYLSNILVVGIVAGAAFTLFVSVVYSKQVFTPVKKITDRVKEISTENLHMRLEPANANDEIGVLGVTFNNMLDRLETAFETQNNFISNASHELGTPLTVIIGEADVALSKNRTAEEYQEALASVLHEAERLERITKSLLFLAQTGFDGKKQKMEILRADQLLWDVKETIDKLNPKNKVYIDLSLVPDNPLKLKIRGNAQLLHLAISNIVSNACKYSSNQPVQVSVGTTNDQVIIVVKDSGIGIPEQELQYIYDPFFRASNTKNFEGYGIGLPLARNIMRQHNGEILVTSAPGQGTTVRLTFSLEIVTSYAIV